MWYTAALFLFAALFWSAAKDKRKGSAARVVCGLMGASLMAWSAYRLATGSHPVTYPGVSAFEAHFMPVSQWGFTQYAAIAVAAFAGVVAVQAYYYFVKRG